MPRVSGGRGVWLRPGGGLASLALGALHTAAFAPLEWWPLQLLAVAGLAWVCRRATVRQAAWRGWCFGAGWLTTGLWWLYISMHDFGGMPAPLAALAVALLAGGLSLYLAASMALWARLRTGRLALDAAAFSACWLLAELARATFFTGFPWMASGYVHTVGPLAALAPWVGVYGMGAWAAWLGAVGAFAAGAPRARASGAALAVALGLTAAAALLPREFTRSVGPLRVSLLQPNVAQDLKFDPDRIVAQMGALQAQLSQARGTLVVTPESVLPVPRDQLDPAWWASLLQPFQAPGRAALVGTFLGNDADGYVNSMVGVAAGAEGYAYGKRHLLPFGEFVPPGFRWFVDLMQIPLGDQASGRTTAPFHVGAQRVRPLICYEDLFGEDFAGGVVGPGAATVLVNASNLAWFGRHMVQDQHLQFSRMRALEFQRPLVRATNTGATAAIDHRGTVTARLPPEVAGTLDVVVDGRAGDTPYARWLAAWGLGPLWGVALAVVGVAGLAGRRGGARGDPPEALNRG